ncbi:MAG: radical SAM protein [Dehalococcoidales bacterium]|nr:radical SAM protein [Dehalococcoidales bacterium]
MRVLLIAYDNDSYIHAFPLGLAYVASALRNQGHEVQVYNQDVYHYPESHLTEFLRHHPFDAVGVGMCGGYYQYQKLKKLRAAVPPDVEFWLGGHIVSPDPGYFRDNFHLVPFIGEYDYTENLDALPYPAWDLFPIDYYSLFRLPRTDNKDRCFPVLSGRGCPFRCNFCYRMYQGYRLRSPEKVGEEIKYLKNKYSINYIQFDDELFMISPERTDEMCDVLQPLEMKWWCNGRLNYAKPKVLKRMREAGCVFVNYGIECFDDTVLKNMNKNLTTKQIQEGIEATLKEGISPGFNMIWGNIGDTKETLRKSVDFLLKYDDHAQLRTIQAGNALSWLRFILQSYRDGITGGDGGFLRE